eukprot:scaffold103389_cov22-Tisochrysis_lutea.AAC.4
MDGTNGQWDSSCLNDCLADVMLVDLAIVQQRQMPAPLISTSTVRLNPRSILPITRNDWIKHTDMHTDILTCLTSLSYKCASMPHVEENLSHTHFG